MPTDQKGLSDWEREMTESLKRLSDLGDEAPPEVADLQMLVVQVQREERRRVLRDLLLFWLCAAAVLSGVIYTLAGQPVYFLMLQAGAVLAMLTVALVVRDRRKRVTP